MKGAELSEAFDCASREYGRQRAFAERNPDSDAAEIAALNAHVAMLRAEVRMKDHYINLMRLALSRRRTNRQGA